ncbi:hypothetical protein CRE_27620 [Caenorhabditis remanei]|uniref:Uncharacterized protein n=1 Tax=Caenorhabditis remanei TaxID=31234 RepID=E3MKJ6_CAERE|nr:hypothetical protein CRE_27620 [Caenorhabditis remanei]
MVPILEIIVSASALVAACVIWKIVSSYNKRKMKKIGKIPFDWDYGVVPWYLSEETPIL